MTKKIDFLLPGLPGDDGRVLWNATPVDYVPGRSLASYLADLGLELSQVSHVIARGRVIDPKEMVFVPLTETKWQRRIRKVRR